MNIHAIISFVLLIPIVLFLVSGYLCPNAKYDCDQDNFDVIMARAPFEEIQPISLECTLSKGNITFSGLIENYLIESFFKLVRHYDYECSISVTSSIVSSFQCSTQFHASSFDSSHYLIFVLALLLSIVLSDWIASSCFKWRNQQAENLKNELPIFTQHAKKVCDDDEEDHGFSRSLNSQDVGRFTQHGCYYYHCY